MVIFRFSKIFLKRNSEEKLGEASTKEEMKILSINRLMSRKKRAVETLQQTIKESVDTFIDTADGLLLKAWRQKNESRKSVPLKMVSRIISVDFQGRFRLS